MDISIVASGENERIIESGTGKVYLKRLDPHGLWWINFEKGAIPKELSGSFTSAGLAYQRVVDYLRSSPQRQRSASKNKSELAKPTNSLE